MKELNIIMANMPIRNGNRGCVALSISSMLIINNILLKKDIKCNFYLTDSQQTNGVYVYDLNGTEIKYNACGYPNWYDLKSFLKQIALSVFKKKEYKENRKVFKNADFIFDIGQGDSFADIYGKRRFDKIDRVHGIARKKNIPYCLLPQTIGPFKNDEIRKQAIKSINKAAVVMARDKQSLNYVKENSTQQNIDEYIDVAFFMPYQKKVFSVEKTHVGINISSLLWHGGYTGNNQFGLKSDYQQLITDIIDFFLTKQDVQIHLVPHVVASESHVENDYEVCYHLANKYNNRVILAPLFFSPIHAKNYIAGMDFFIGARMHAAIAAFSSGVPVFPMAYSRKFNGLFVDTLDYPFMGDLVHQNSDTLLNELKISFGKRDELRSKIDERMKGVVVEKEKMLIHSISKFLNIDR